MSGVEGALLGTDVSGVTPGSRGWSKWQATSLGAASAHSDLAISGAAKHRRREAVSGGLSSTFPIASQRIWK